MKYHGRQAPEKGRARKKLKVTSAEVPPLAPAPPIVTYLVPDPKGEDPLVTPVCPCPHLTAGKKLMEDAIQAAHVVNTRQNFPEASLFKRCLLFVML